ncbi:MAG: ATP synthase gamma chain [Candidatus Woesebacteria bacterium GW2011_GWB1_41_10]|uniref:ATP synthase gamma chain n=1 Tax=Candidatus Woesebacteria bacterium GW2011_GWB1_41_10 TaxID=1618577 RepID=A0A0G0U9X3_9BACT|nr:MAG: ATP synthase gamma chain [Candidatus Woesebacteria bacterium GW2011_GWB1_41_10]
MRTIKKIINESSETQEIRGLIGIYEEIAAGKMQEIRGGIMNARDFFERLTILSSEVGADLETAGLGTSGEGAVFVSAGTGLFGDLIDKIFFNFMDFVRKNPKVDKFVIGKLGDEMMKTLAGNTDYKYYDLVDEELKGEELSVLMKELVVYKKIYLFYGKFGNIVNQETRVDTVSGQVLGNIQDEKSLSEQKFLYLYEPTIVEIAKVFSEEIAGAIFNQTIAESRLAKYAARLMHLDSALEKVDDRLMNLSLEKMKAAKRIGEKKQMSSYAGLVAI